MCSAQAFGGAYPVASPLTSLLPPTAGMVKVCPVCNKPGPCRCQGACAASTCTFCHCYLLYKSLVARTPSLKELTATALGELLVRSAPGARGELCSLRDAFVLTALDAVGLRATKDDGTRHDSQTVRCVVEAYLPEGGGAELMSQLLNSYCKAVENVVLSKAVVAEHGPKAKAKLPQLHAGERVDYHPTTANDPWHIQLFQLRSNNVRYSKTWGIDVHSQTIRCTVTAKPVGSGQGRQRSSFRASRGCFYMSVKANCFLSADLVITLKVGSCHCSVTHNFERDGVVCDFPYPWDGVSLSVDGTLSVIFSAEPLDSLEAGESRLAAQQA